MMAQPLTILFMPESAYGPTNNCIGIGDVLRRRGHRVVFAAEASWNGRLDPLGFVEDLVDLAPPPAADAPAQDAGQFWKDFIRDTAPEFRKPTVDQLATFMQPTWQALIDGAKYCEPHLSEIIARQQPDVIVEDNVVSFPALQTAGKPFVRIVSCNPLEIRGADVAPPYSGLPADDRSQWEAFRQEYDRTHRPTWEDFDAWCREQGTAPLPELEFIHTSSDLNLYVYPEAADYADRRPLGGTWRRRLVAVLGDTPHRYIVSKGPQHADYDLAPNMWGAEFLPQTKIVPLVDLVITHGGNNTTTEAFHFGKPMVVLPLFWDQYDNAQRVDETGFGVRLPTYAFEPAALHGAIERLLRDTALRARMAGIGAGIRARDGVAKAADAIESAGLARR
jgi:UDP:flavonoid glycosyltransferase YjiC (YdhE family)